MHVYHVGDANNLDIEVTSLRQKFQGSFQGWIDVIKQKNREAGCSELQSPRNHDSPTNNTTES
jgi:hypothetical protein